MKQVQIGTNVHVNYHFELNIEVVLISLYVITYTSVIALGLGMFMFWVILSYFHTFSALSQSASAQYSFSNQYHNICISAICGTSLFSRLLS